MLPTITVLIIKSHTFSNNICTTDVRYIITVVTGDKVGAGTDADVYLQLFGELG